MEIRQDIFLKYLEKAAAEQLAEEYRQKGYAIEFEKQVDDFIVDLVASKGDDVLAFEIKAGEWSSDKRQNVRRLRNFVVHRLGAKFKLVLVNLPKKPDIEVDGLDSLFFELLPEHFVSEFSELASHFWVEEVTDVQIDFLAIRSEDIELAGTGTITLGLQFGSDHDYKVGDGLRTLDAHFFNFHLVLNKDLTVKEIIDLEFESEEENE